MGTELAATNTPDAVTMKTEATQEAAPIRQTETVNVPLGEAPVEGDREVEEVEAPVTEPGTLVFPKVRID